VNYFMTRHADLEICHRIAKLRLETAGPRGKAFFAKELGLSPSTYDYYETTRVPPAEVLVKIAERTGVDLYWLLTGKARSGIKVAADHPLVQRVARLLADSPDAAGPLAAFLEILSGVQKFPPAQVEQPSPSERSVTPADAWPASAAAKSPAAVTVDVPKAKGPTGRGVEVARQDAQDDAKESWIPILGRTAAGVAHFWAETDDSAGVTMLEDLVERYCRASGSTVRTAAAAEQGAAGETTVQVITLPAGAKLHAAEFVAAPVLKARYGDVFALRIDGESMAPDIRHGDIVILSPSVPAVDGRAAVVQLVGQIGVICKLYRRVGERVHLIPIHEQFAPQTHPASKVRWALAVLARVRV
jgi:SOS-response transcriptional repressor LexA